MTGLFATHLLLPCLVKSLYLFWSPADVTHHQTLHLWKWETSFERHDTIRNMHLWKHLYKCQLKPPIMLFSNPKQRLPRNGVYLPSNKAPCTNTLTIIHPYWICLVPINWILQPTHTSEARQQIRSYFEYWNTCGILPRNPFANLSKCSIQWWNKAFHYTIKWNKALIIIKQGL